MILSKKTAELTAAIQKTEEVAFYREVEKQIAQNQKNFSTCGSNQSAPKRSC